MCRMHKGRALFPLPLLVGRGVALLLLAAALSGCSQDMWNGSRLKPLEPNPFFADGRSSRPLPTDVVAREWTADDPLERYTDAHGRYLDSLPYPLTRQVLDRGQLEFNTYCAECHGRTGYGDGIVPRRGYPAPPSYHSDRLRGAPLGHFYDVITNGYGVMYPYNDRVAPADRWAIAAYIRALQLSQNARPGDIPPDEMRKLEGGGTAAVPPVALAPRETPLTENIPLVRLPGEALQGAPVVGGAR